MSGKYILKDKVPVEIDDILEWGRQFEEANRVVAKTQIGESRVSTVFLGLDHNWSDDGPPLLFETMVFGGPLDQEQERCSTWEEAEEMHKQMCERVKEAK